MEISEQWYAEPQPDGTVEIRTSPNPQSGTLIALVFEQAQPGTGLRNAATIIAAPALFRALRDLARAVMIRVDDTNQVEFDAACAVLNLIGNVKEPS